MIYDFTNFFMIIGVMFSLVVCGTVVFYLYVAAYLFAVKKLNNVKSARDMVIKYQAMKQELAEMKKAVRHD